MHGHNARNRHAALLPAGKFKRAFLQQLVGKANESSGLLHAAVDLGFVQPHVARAVGDVLGAGLLKQLVLRVLHDQAHLEAERPQVSPLLPHILAVNQDAAGGGAVQAIEMADEGGFTAAGGADDADKVALLHAERYVIQRGGFVRHAGIVDVFQMFYTNDL